MLWLIANLALADVDQGLQAFEAGDYQQALESWRAIKAGDPVNAEAWFALGLMHEKGWGVVAEQEKARQYYLIAANHQLPSALFKLGAFAAKTKDYQQAIDYWRQSAVLKTPEAAYNLAHIYRQGLGVDKDEQEATYWYKRAANFALEKQKSLIYPGQGKDIVQFVELGDILALESDSGSTDNVRIASNQLAFPQVVATANAQDNVTNQPEVLLPGDDPDADGVKTDVENKLKTDPENPDTDGDGISDGDEINRQLNPLAADSDEDGLSDAEELSNFTNPLKADTDGDGLNDSDEFRHGTDAYFADTDNDGLSDGDEIKYNTFPLSQDSDNDGVLDGEEVALGLNPVVTDSDGDGIDDGEEIALRSNPANADSDQDGLEDGFELEQGTNITIADSDDDGLSDAEELELKLNPIIADTDGDGVSDGEEVAQQTDPLIADKPEQTPVTQVDDQSEVVAETDNPQQQEVDQPVIEQELAEVVAEQPEQEEGQQTEVEQVAQQQTIEDDPALADSDGGGISDTTEVDQGPDLADLESDNERLIDKQELQPQTDALLADIDDDVLSDDQETQFNTNALKQSPDLDGVDDNVDINDSQEVEQAAASSSSDNDNDGLTDAQEVIYKTSPTNADTDGDGVSDGIEVMQNTQPLQADTDNDGLTDGEELFSLTNPRSADTDDDGLNDIDELANETNPLIADTDEDGLIDGLEVELGTDPLAADSDEDGINDGDERELGSNPLLADTDGDGLVDSQELELQTSLIATDSDNDGLSDAQELEQGTDPLVAEVEPQPEQSQELSANIVASTNSLDPVEILQQSEQNWRWIINQEKNKFTVQLLNSSNLDQIIDFVDNYNLSAEVRIIPSLQDGIVNYKTILGSYDNWFDAGQKIAGLPRSIRSTTPLIRTFASLYQENPHADLLGIATERPSQTLVNVQQSGSSSAAQSEVKDQADSLSQVPRASRPSAKPKPATIIKRAPNIFGNNNSQSNTDSDSDQRQSASNEKSTGVSSDSEPVAATAPQIAATTRTQPTNTQSPASISNPLFNNQIVEKGMSTADVIGIRKALDFVRDNQYQRAINILTPMANSRNADARYRLALMVRQGLGVKQRPQFAFRLAKLAAEQGHPHAKQLLAQFYLQGYGVAENPAEAAKWL